jgi:hypothetical protein
LQRLIADQAADDAGGGTSRALDDESTDALDYADNLDPETEPDPGEPGRMPELDQYPGGEQRDVPLANIRPTQDGISPVTGDGTPLEEMSAQIREAGGMDRTQPAAQMVQNEDGTLSTLDHRRISAAEGAELEEVPAEVFPADEPIPEDQAERFTLKKKLIDPETGEEYPAGATPKTWGEAAKFRAANQNPGRFFPRPGRTPDIAPPK